MAVRDRVVRWALAVGAVLTVLSWRFVGPWAALVLMVLALGVAAVAYRIEASRIDLEHPAAWHADPAERRPAGSDVPAERVDQ